MQNSQRSDPNELREAYYASLHRDVMVYEALDDVLRKLGRSMQAMRLLAGDDLREDHQHRVLRAVAELANEAGLLRNFEDLLANVALARRDWELLSDLGVRGISFEVHPVHLCPEGSCVDRHTAPSYFDGAHWSYRNGRSLLRIYGEGAIEQVARHLVGALIDIAAVRLSDSGGRNEN
jgi:hypothetical protein